MKKIYDNDDGGGDQKGHIIKLYSRKKIAPITYCQLLIQNLLRRPSNTTRIRPNFDQEKSTFSFDFKVNTL